MDLQESAVRATVDVPENRFVKVFLDQALGIVDQMQVAAENSTTPSFRDRVKSECVAMRKKLLERRRASLWTEVGKMGRLPAESTVLQGRRGYREVYRHFLRLRMTARVPLNPANSMWQLESKDIAQLYELWCFFQVEQSVTSALGSAPTKAGIPIVGDLAARLPYDFRVAWEDGTTLFYNRSYSRAEKRPRSYSVPLRPDIVLRVPNGPNKGEHIFDAKFRLQRLDELVSADEAAEDEEEEAERRGVFKLADLYKMHTYRDAIPSARSVWILFPGSEFAFFPAEDSLTSDLKAGKRVQTVKALPSVVTGVGAIPVVPGATQSSLLSAIGFLLAKPSEVKQFE
jgi:predicted component of viral defense system (DUF524 family)